MSDQPQTAADIRAFVEDRDIRFVRLWFTDVLGQLKSFSIHAQELEDAFEGGMGFDGSSITGFNAIEESDMIAMPDATTFNVLPWRPEGDGMSSARSRWGSSTSTSGLSSSTSCSATRAAPRCSTRAATSTSRRWTRARTSG